MLNKFLLAGMAGVAAFAIDYGNAAFNRLEAQRTAESAAMAGAVVYALTDSWPSASGTVRDVASMNGYSGCKITAMLVGSSARDGHRAVKVIVNSVPLSLIGIALGGKVSATVGVTSLAKLMSRRSGAARHHTV